MDSPTDRTYIIEAGSPFRPRSHGRLRRLLIVRRHVSQMSAAVASNTHKWWYTKGEMRYCKDPTILYTKEWDLMSHGHK